LSITTTPAGHTSRGPQTKLSADNFFDEIADAGPVGFAAGFSHESAPMAVNFVDWRDSIARLAVQP